MDPLTLGAVLIMVAALIVVGVDVIVEDREK